MSNEQEQIDIVEPKLQDDYAELIAKNHMRKMQELAPREYYTIKVNGIEKRYNRRKILTRERKDIEILKQKYTKAVQENSATYPHLEDKLYKTMADLYLRDSETGNGMTPNDFEACEYEDLKQILNACAFRTERPIPSPF